MDFRSENKVKLEQKLLNTQTLAMERDLNIKNEKTLKECTKPSNNNMA